MVLATKGKAKGKPVPDADLRDTENVPLAEDVQAYFDRPTATASRPRLRPPPGARSDANYSELSNSSKWLGPQEVTAISDKHAKEGEPPVRLCNYTDVYYNDRITADLDFMAATATPEQVASFTLLDHGDEVRRGLKDLLLNHSGLYETLRARAAADLR